MGRGDRADVRMQPSATQGGRPSRPRLPTRIDRDAVLLQPIRPHFVCREGLLSQTGHRAVEVGAQDEGQRLLRRIERQSFAARAQPQKNKKALGQANDTRVHREPPL
jgi:hypothetical protein